MAYLPSLCRGNLPPAFCIADFVSDDSGSIVDSAIFRVEFLDKYLYFYLIDRQLAGIGIECLKTQGDDMRCQFSKINICLY